MPFRKLNRKIRITAVVLALFGTVAFGFEWISGVLQSRNATLRAGEINVMNVAHSVSSQAALSLRAAETIIRELLKERAATSSGNASMADLMRALTTGQPALFPEIDSVSLADKEGNILYAWSSNAGAKHSMQDRYTFAPTGRLALSELTVGAPTQSPISNHWIIPISQSLTVDGRPAGVAMVGLSINFFSRAFEKSNIGKDGAIILGSMNGTILLRRPSATMFAGKSVSEDPLFREFIQQRAPSSLISKKTLDGVERLIYFERVQGMPLFVTTALGRDELLSDWYRSLAFQVGGTTIAAIIIALLTAYLAWAAKLRQSTERELESKNQTLSQLNDQLKNQAMKDGMTGLANRRYLDEQVTRAIQASSRAQSSVAIIMFDVDRFKKFNDLYGHIQGDYCLQAVARELQLAQRRVGDVAARYGGEEFVLLLPDTDLVGAHLIAQKVLDAIRNLKYPHIGNETGVVTVSAGVASIVPNQSTTLEELYSMADKALYKAKNNGRDQVCD